MLYKIPGWQYINLICRLSERLWQNYITYLKLISVSVFCFLCPVTRFPLSVFSFNALDRAPDVSLNSILITSPWKMLQIQFATLHNGLQIELQALQMGN